MFEKTIRIDLKLPRSWNQCTPEQLETIAACIMKHAALSDRYHPYDWIEVKTELFFLLSNTEILRKETNPDDPEDTVIVCRQTKKSRRFPFSVGGGSAAAPSFNLRPWQVSYWIDTQLKWLDDDNASLILFPYKTLIFKRQWQWKWPFLKKKYFLPSELLQDCTWQQYRHLQDYMDLYVKQQNHLVQLAQRTRDAKQLLEVQQAMTATRNTFLKILFTTSHPDKPLSASECAAVAKKVTRISSIQWQVILLWWSGMMHYLKEHYPRCFKAAPKTKKKQKQHNPLELYTSIIATMQKYIGIDEEKVNNQTFHVILEQLERIAKENEEIDKINRKHK